MSLQQSLILDRTRVFQALVNLMHVRSLLCGFLLMLTLPAMAQNTGQTVDRIKTAYVYNFAKFVDFSGLDDKTIRICVFGKDDLNGSMLSLNHRMAQGREILVRKDVTLDQLKDCNMVFVSELELRALPVVARQLGNAPILLVGEGQQAVDRGAHLALVHNDDRVEFDVNMLNLQKSNIKASSQMLKLARAVIR